MGHQCPPICRARRVALRHGRSAIDHWHRSAASEPRLVVERRSGAPTHVWGEETSTVTEIVTTTMRSCTPSRFTARDAPTISSVNAGKSARDRNSRNAAALRRGTRGKLEANMRILLKLRIAERFFNASLSTRKIHVSCLNFPYEPALIVCFFSTHLIPS